MPVRYAANTEVSSARSREEIERILTRYGADQVMVGIDRTSAIFGFRIHGRLIRYTLAMPDRDSDEFRLTPSRRWKRSEKDQQDAYEQAVRQRWRALALVIKAKLEAVEAGITSIEAEFLSATSLPSGETVSDWIEPQIKEAYETGQMPESLPGLSTTKRLPAGSKR